MKTRKIIEIHERGINILVKRIDRKYNPYVIYNKWYDYGWHQKKLTEFADLPSVMCFLKDYTFEHYDERMGAYYEAK